MLHIVWTVNETINFIFMSKGRVSGPCSEPVELKLYPHVLFACTNFTVNTVLSNKVFKSKRNTKHVALEHLA